MSYPPLVADNASAVAIFDPLLDERWPAFIDQHPQSSIFHTRGWIQALKRTYGFHPIGVTSSARGDALSDCVLFCEVDSRLTGRRLVSLPFSDHCQPLVSAPAELDRILCSLAALSRQRGWDYVELRFRRPLRGLGPEGAAPLMTTEYCFHQLDLTPSANDLFAGMHKSCIQRKVRRARREQLIYQSGRSGELLEHFYRLLVATRQRHQLPPQPIAWFRNLVESLTERLTIHLVSTPHGRAVASILTLEHRDEMVYKYGCSDPGLNPLGGMPFLLWEAIRQAKESRATSFDLGRSDLDNTGLITFKSRLGAVSTPLYYHKYPGTAEASALRQNWFGPSRKLIPMLPKSVLRVAGSLLYRHFG